MNPTTDEAAAVEVVKQITPEAIARIERDQAYWLEQAREARRNLESYDQERWLLIRKTYAPSLNDEEFLLFIQHAKREGLDPARRQMYAWASVNQRQERELVFVAGVHGLVARLNRNPSFEGIVGAAIHLGDDYRVSAAEGKVHHEWGLDRGALVGAWAMGSMRGRRPVIREVQLAHFIKSGERGKFWSAMPDVMIAKTAVIHVARALDPEGLAGFSAPEEFGGISTPDGRVFMPGENAPKPISKDSIAVAPWVKRLEGCSTMAELDVAVAEAREAVKLMPKGAQLLMVNAKEVARARIEKARAPEPPSDEPPPDVALPVWTDPEVK